MCRVFTVVTIGKLTGSDRTSLAMNQLASAIAHIKPAAMPATRIIYALCVELMFTRAIEIVTGMSTVNAAQ